RRETLGALAIINNAETKVVFFCLLKNSAAGFMFLLTAEFFVRQQIQQKVFRLHFMLKKNSALGRKIDASIALVSNASPNLKNQIRAVGSKIQQLESLISLSNYCCCCCCCLGTHLSAKSGTIGLC
ncbi:hypothetical protein GIB67_013994, partial [Kingdonia uniflora]